MKTFKSSRQNILSLEFCCTFSKVKIKILETAELKPADLNDLTEVCRFFVSLFSWQEWASIHFSFCFWITVRLLMWSTKRWQKVSEGGLWLTVLDVQSAARPKHQFTKPTPRIHTMRRSRTKTELRSAASFFLHSFESSSRLTDVKPTAPDLQQNLNWGQLYVCFHGKHRPLQLSVWTSRVLLYIQRMDLQTDRNIVDLHRLWFCPLFMFLAVCLVLSSCKIRFVWFRSIVHMMFFLL